MPAPYDATPRTCVCCCLIKRENKREHEQPTQTLPVHKSLKDNIITILYGINYCNYEIKTMCTEGMSKKYI